MLDPSTAPAKDKEDLWIKSTCFMCWNTCGIRVRRVEGVIVKIEGDPDCPQNWGRICAKGNSGFMSLYDPKRVLHPMRRTNPEKGFGVDPRWQRISWDEALEIVGQRLAKLRRQDPRKLVVSSFDTRGQSGVFFASWTAAFGTPNFWGGGAQYYCGNGYHPVTYLTHGTWFGEPDIRNCRYLMLFGTQNGSVTNHLPMELAAKMADARMDGMKLVVVDPLGINAGSKANEWVPIRPGTDGALALSMINVLLNEENVYDREFLARYTNGSYLIGNDGHYVRDAATGKPLMWDTQANKARPFDDPEFGAVALEGRFTIDGCAVATGFTLFKENVKSYTPEKVGRITTVPAETIRRLAHEFGKAARIGSTITIGGHELPYRPAAANWYRGATAHKHGMLTGLAIQFLNVIVGAIDVPGGHLGNNPVSQTAPLHWAPIASADGLIVPQGYARRRKPPYPATKVKAPERYDLLDLCPIAPYGGPFFTEAVLHPQRYKLDYDLDTLIVCRSNLLMTCANADTMAAALKKIPFVVAFACEMNETAEFADILLPDTHYLERLDAIPNEPTEFVGAGEGHWYWMLRQPVIAPLGEARNWVEVLVNLAEKLDMRRDLYALLNATLDLKEPYAYRADELYSWSELADRWFKSWFGPEKGLDWFKENGTLVTGTKKITEAYPRTFMTPRLPIYVEYFLGAGEELKKVADDLGIHWDTSDYQALVNWKPCAAFEQNSAEHDLFVINFKLPFHSLSYTTQNGYLKELSEKNPYAYSLLLNSATARQKGIRGGERIRLTTPEGYQAEGQAYLSECIHPEVVGIAGCFGRKSRALHSFGKGVHFNSLVPQQFDRIDALSAALDSCVRVKVEKL
jgi:molybdopterin-containing oxidoreductase family molybdopterin binding subunit